MCILAIFGDLLEGYPQKFSGSLSLAIFSGPLNILPVVVIRALRTQVQCNEYHRSRTKASISSSF